MSLRASVSRPVLLVALAAVAGCGSAWFGTSTFEPLHVEPAVALADIPEEFETMRSDDLAAVVAWVNRRVAQPAISAGDREILGAPLARRGRSLDVVSTGGIGAIRRVASHYCATVVPLHEGRPVPPVQWLHSAIEFDGPSALAVDVWYREIARRLVTEDRVSASVTYAHGRSAGVVVEVRWTAAGLPGLVVDFRLLPRGANVSEWGPSLAGVATVRTYSSVDRRVNTVSDALAHIECPTNAGSDAGAGGGADGGVSNSAGADAGDDAER